MPIARPDSPLPLVVRIAAWLSDGIRLCVTDGPASGRMMAYAYRNVPSGRGWIGRSVDRRFLAYPGWEGVRQRRRVLADLLSGLVDASATDRPVRLLDVAGGTADYVFDVVAARPDRVTARCVDRDRSAVDAGRRRAADLSAAVRFDVGDATDPAVLAEGDARPDVVCCSGLYELIADDTTVARSIGTVAALLPVGGRYVVSHQTSQPTGTGRVGGAIWRTMAPRAPLTFRSAERVRSLLVAAGLVVERVGGAGGRYAVLVARREA